VFCQYSFDLFQIPVFETFLNTRIWQRGIQSSGYPRHHQISARACM